MKTRHGRGFSEADSPARRETSHPGLVPAASQPYIMCMCNGYAQHVRWASELDLPKSDGIKINDAGPITRFIPATLLPLFESTTWPVAATGQMTDRTQG